MKRNVRRIIAAGLCVGLLSGAMSGCGKKKEPVDLPSAILDPAFSSPLSVAETEPPAMVSVAVVKNADSGLRVRDTASVEGEVLGIVQNNDTFRLKSTEPNDDWYAIVYQGEDGYLFADYVSVEEITETEMAKKEGGFPTKEPGSADTSDADTSDADTDTGGEDSGSAPDPQSTPVPEINEQDGEP